ncbi:hypothetical protein LUW75_06375 [Streptomyces sp. MRC013]|uniref:hypothetical protein n=1 Tax=Streptomyces sp. MRC013 TaxID=2898276 RepID=UPI002025F127|nr:hypothetical protein [Streptomyces sp. MRC013]URM89680.1 hypothetical protein LUW75_06375 [Streptomyces sp. MRC013]
MRRRPAPQLLVLALPLLLSACGTSAAGARTPDRAVLEARAAALRTRPEHVYVTRADGFDLAEQSVGVLGDDGFSASYVAEGGRTITLSVERGGVDAAGCARTAAGAGGAPGGTPCERDGAGWYLAAEHGHAYLRFENGLRIRVGADRAVDRGTLRGAAERARRASDEELDAVLPDLAPGRPVDRGDLPPESDGAPRNDVGTSG